MTHRRTHRMALGAVVGALCAGTLLLSACAGSSGGGSNDSQAPGSTAPAGTSGPSGSSGAGAPVKGGNLTVQISQDPGSLDPDASGNISTGTISHYLFEGLVSIDANNEPQPMLAKSYQSSDGGKTWTFVLRDGLKFSDGTPLTSKDAVASLKYWMANSSYGQPVGKMLASLTAPDAKTVVVKLNKPWPLTTVMAGSDAQIVLKAAIASKLTAKGFTKDQAIGEGPYKLKSWTPGQSIVIERNPYYQSRTEAPSGRSGAKHAYLDTITFKVVKDANAAMNGLQTGQWDVYTTPTTDQYAQLKSMSNVAVHTVASGTTYIAYINHHKGSIFSNPKAREAFNLAINKKAINDIIGIQGLTVNSGSYVAASDKALYSTAGKDVYDAYDPARAKQLFEQAGYHGQTIRILTTGEFSQFPQMATEMQAELKKIGVKAKIGTYDFGTMIDKAKKYDWDIMPLSDGANVVLPQQSIEVTGLLPFLGVPGGYDSPAMNAAIDKFSTATSDADRRAAADTIQKLVWQDLPAIVYNMTPSYVAYTPKLAGYDHYGLDFWNAWLKK